MIESDGETPLTSAKGCSPEPLATNSHLTTKFNKITINVITHRLVLSSGSFPKRCRPKGYASFVYPSQQHTKPTKNTLAVPGDSCKSPGFLTCNILNCPFTLSFLGQNIFLSSMLSSNLCCSFTVPDHVLHPYKRNDRISVLCASIFRVLEIRSEDRNLWRWTISNKYIQNLFIRSFHPDSRFHLLLLFQDTKFLTISMIYYLQLNNDHC